jgi:hypothetical protein
MTSVTRVRRVAPLVGLLLIAAAVWAVLGNRAVLAAAWSSLRDPSRPWVLALAAATTAAFLCTSAGLLLLTNRVARESRLTLPEMLALVLASSLGNMIPLQPGLVGRVAYQHQVHGIPVVASVLLVVQSTLLTLVTVAWLALALMLVHAGGLSWLAAPLSLVLLMTLVATGAARLRPFLGPLAIRSVEVLLGSLRTMAAFALVGTPIDPMAALVFGCAAAAANCVPGIGGGLGVREWIVALLAPAVAGVATPDALAAELVNRAAELIVVVPGGLLGGLPIARRLHLASRTRRVHAGDTTAEHSIRIAMAAFAAQRRGAGPPRGAAPAPPGMDPGRNAPPVLDPERAPGVDDPSF